MSRPLLVVAGVIQRSGEILICQRQEGDSHAFKWEFPGGKVEAGESPREALQRELNEELGIRAVVADEIARYEYRYARRPPILLIFFRVSDYEGEPASMEFQQIRWVKPESLKDFDFLDGDRDFVRRLARGEYLSRR